MFIFGQALLPPLIGAECENVEWLSHDGTNSPAVITCTVLSMESILAKKIRPAEWDAIFLQMCQKSVPKYVWNVCLGLMCYEISRV